ncbi:protogenin-like isoform X1 [Apis mellifera caucasica]|uniref:Protogenin-like isoform X1 n=1 Tax=Apis mellifera TaxID=7460 RepID=A0A7M7L679_APIME|nr:protogenin-like isoform X1 [Apis mellifera]KAG6802324.1 protogenin-like isoform X1 [Apis mellifera caucasica]KAG9432269.1 protogenin-like isoform X1 [Apis mellifera carnica]|eukprot:XP_026295917.1 protogenin-like isoform X1 [Apis mellifera]
MAARVFLLSILFTEVLKPVYAAGVKEIGIGLHNKNVSKSEGFNINPTKASGITLEVQPSGHVILGKKGITLTCITGSNQNISWLHNGISAPPCGITRCTLLKNGSLHLHKMVQKFREKNITTINFRDYYKDEYRCVAHTNFGLLRSSPTFIQIAEFAYIFKESPENITVQEGEITRLSCLIDSVPFPNITWQHNEKILLPNQNNLNNKYIMVPPGVLYIKATKLSDAGTYRCIVNNEFLKKTKKSKEAKLTVISQPEGNGSYIPPLLFPQISYNHWLLNGSNLSLACAASGYPPPIIMWSFIPRYIANHNVAQPRILLNSSIGISILSLVNVSASDAGVYICSVKNFITNNVEIQNITVNILIPPSFVKIPTNQICPNGRTARFECQAQGLPVPKIYWLKDSLNITINGRRTVYIKESNKMELAISATVPSDAGIYQCVAVNSAGEIWAAGRLQVNTSRNSPAAPTSLKCRALSPVKIFISWVPPKSLSHSSIKAYTVHYSPVEGGKEEVSPPEPGNSTSVEVTKLLEPYTNYSFYIRVWNNYGPSDQSATILCSTAPSVPKGAPKVNVNILSSTKLNISWEPLTKKESRGIVVEYKLQFRLHEHPSSRVYYLSANNKSYILSDLKPGAQYDLRVLARTKQGWPNVTESQLKWTTVTMPPAESNQFVIKNIVDVQVLIVNTSIVKVKWKINVNENDKIESKFDLWQIYCENQSGHKLENIFLPQNVTEYVFTNLNVNVSFTMGLCMISSGKATGCLTKQIETSTNNVPMALEAIPVSSTSINVTWSLNGVHEINSFELCYHAIHAANSDNPKCSILNDTKANVDKLKPFTLYQFKVRAIQNNTNQSNFYSESVECYTNEDIPGKVEEVQWFLINNTKIRIAWKEPSNINGIIQNYFIIYTMDLMDSVKSWRNVTVPGNKTSTTLPGLIPGKRYFVMVQAMTKAGYGKLSDPIIILTGGSSNPPNPQKPSQNIRSDQSLGVILGVSISIGFIKICLCSIYCRKKCENARILRETAQSTKNRTSVRNRCCTDQMSTSVSQQINSRVVPNEIELAVLCPTSPITNPHLDTKGGKSNGILESCVKEPLLPSWEINGEQKDIHTTKNSQYKIMDNVVLNEQKQDQEQDLDGTQLTIVNCTLKSSNSSLNNNSGCPDGDTSLSKSMCISVPTLGPNG